MTFASLAKRVSFGACACTLALVLAAILPLARGQQPPAGLQAVITTVNDEQISTQITALADGKLSLATDPPRTIPLAEVQRIEIGKIASSATTTAELSWVGQDNHDLVQVGGASGGNGIQDLHLHATSLKPQGLKQIVVVCRFPKQLRVWRFDTSQSPHWRLAIARADLASEAELYLEPPNEDCFGQKFEITYTYNDGATVKASTTATTHTSDQQKVDRAVQPGQVVSKPAADNSSAKSDVYLADGGRLQGEIVELSAESLTVRTPWQADVQVPLLRVKGLWFGNTAPTGARSDFDKRMATPVVDDVVFLVGPDKAAAEVAGSVQGLADGKLKLRFQGQDKSINQPRLLGLVFAAHPKVPQPAATYQVFLLAGGDTLSGNWVGFENGTLEIETLWLSRVKVRPADVGEIRLRNGRLTFLPDLEPIAVEEVPYFGRMIHWRRDQGFDGEPPRVKGKQPSRSLAMHSHCVLTFALDEQYDSFKSTIGFDDSAGTRGRVACRVLVDGREAFVQKDFRSDQDPQTVDVPVKGAKQLALEVDFGEGEDVGDRVIWAEPRLFRSEAK